MAMDETTLQAQLTAIQAAITTALASPAPNWQVGQVKFNQTEYLKFLYEQQSELLKQIRSIPSEDISTTQDGVGPLGNDSAEYYGEDQ